MSIKNFFKQIENIFLIFALVFGLLYIFITPPFQNVDENSHFYRVIGIVSNAQIVKDNGRVGVLLPYKYIDYSSSYNYLIKNVAAKVKKLIML